jgi:hypothetical protein
MKDEARSFTLPSDLGAQIGPDTLARLVGQITGAGAAGFAAGVLAGSGGS